MSIEGSKSAVSSFASLLAGLTAPKQKTDELWTDDALADDVATISYEQALRTHTRSRRPNPPPHPVPATDPAVDTAAQTVRITEWVPNDQTHDRVADHKTASITLRMSKAECLQLRQRASDAGLSVSAYLRSCVFEAESLRAQVRDTLAQLRPGPAIEAQSLVAPSPPERSTHGWATRLFGHRNRNLADA